MTEAERLKKERKRCLQRIEDINLEQLAIGNQRDVENKTRSQIIDELEQKRRKAIKEKTAVIEALDQQLRDIDRRLYEAQKALREIEEALREEEFANRDLVLSDHAILRFLERKKKMDLDKVKKEMLSEDMKNTARLCRGNFEYRGFIVKNNVVITVLPE